MKSLTSADGHRVFQGILQLTNIPRPGVAQQSTHRIGCQPYRAIMSAADPGEQMPGQGFNVFAALSERWDPQRHDPQTVVEILAKLLLHHGLPKILIGGGDHPGIGSPGFAFTDPLEGPLLENPQELDLQGQGKIADFVEKDGASCRQLEAAGPIANGTGKSTPNMTKELTLEEISG